MKKCYTIIAFFSCGDYVERNECWIANFSNKEDAIKCFKQKMGECGCSCNINTIFDNLVNNGGSFHNTSDGTMFFVRNEEIQEKFDNEKTSWK